MIIFIVFISFPLIAIIFGLMVAQNVRMDVVFGFGFIYIGVVLYFLKKSYLKAKEQQKQAKERLALRKIESKANWSAFSFKNSFGFDPKFLNEKRYQKEVLIKLAFQAKEMSHLCQKRDQGHSFVNRMLYEEAFARYQKNFSALEQFHPDFASTLPHWTNLWAFSEEWCRDNSV